MNQAAIQFCTGIFWYEAYGIDNGYSGLKDISFLPKHIGKNIGSSAKFAVGDITKHTEFPDKTFSCK